MRAPYTLSMLVPALGLLMGQSPNWIDAGNRAFAEGRAAEAAADYSRALDEQARAGTPAVALLQLRLGLAATYLEAGNPHGAEAVLHQVDEAGLPIDDGCLRAQLLNTRAAIHTFQGRFNDTERELGEARSILEHMREPGDLLPTVLHNLAGVEMKTGAYADALRDEQTALSMWEPVLQPDDPHFVKAFAALGALQYLLGRPREAHQSLERSIGSARKAYGPDNLLVAQLLDSHAVILDRLKRKKDAKLARSEAYRIRGGQATSDYSRNTWNVRDALAPGSSVYLSLN